LEALEQEEFLESLGKSAAKIKPFVTMIQAFRAKLQLLSLKEFMQDLLDVTGYVDYLKESDEEDADDRIENVEELLAKVSDFEDVREAASLSEFLEEVALVADVDKLRDDDNHVVLMTLHAAKGLEFPSVYLAGMEDGIFPSYMTIVSDDPTEVEEERRLAYVGITRAMEDLSITCAKQRMQHGQTQYNPLSRFVKEIPQHLLDGSLPVSRKYEEPYRESGNTYMNRSSLFGGQLNFGEKKEAPVQKVVSLNEIPGLTKGMGLCEPDYDVGDKVRHIKFGVGEVTGIEKGSRDYQITVEFETAGKRVMYAQFAKLKKI